MRYRARRCGPAHRALGVSRDAGLLLPGNVVRADGDRSVVQALDPELFVQVTGTAALEPIASEAAQPIDAALADPSA